MKEIGGICESVGCYHRPASRPFYAVSYRPSPLLSVRGLLQAERAFAVALPEAEQLAGLNRRLAAQLPPAVARVCRMAGLQGDTAVVFCANSTAASRVRAQAKSLAAHLSTPRAPVSAIKVKVRADWTLPEPAEKQDLSESALKAFDSLERDLPEGGLRDAIHALLARRRDR